MSAAIDRAAASTPLAGRDPGGSVAAETADDPLGIARAASAPLPALAEDGSRPPVDPGAVPLDGTADVPEVLSTALARRAELLLLLAREKDQTQQAKLDRMRSDFDNASAERTEQLREMNALRDMAIEQMKKDDDVLKKFITMI